MLSITLNVRSGKDVPLDVEPLINETEYRAFMRAFQEYAEEDDYINHKKKDHFMWFSFHDEVRERKVEVPRNCKTLPSSLIYLQFNPTVSPEKVKYTFYIPKITRIHSSLILFS